MRVGITQRITTEDEYGEIRDTLSHDWLNYFRKILPDVILVPIPNIDLREVWLREMQLEALILSNGNDIGEYLLRDEAEKIAIDYAIKESIPIIGFCRGFQLLNKFLGGNVSLELVNNIGVNHVSVEHQVCIENQVFLDLLGKDHFMVNSFHGHGVISTGLSSSLEIFAISDSQIVEGFIHKSLPILGIQWHPERINNCERENEIILSKLLLEGKFW